MDKAEAARTPAEQACDSSRKDASLHTPVPPAGPHAKLHLTNEAATPGAGALPATSPKEADVDGGVG